jgi:hypothetical protein
MTDSVAPTQQLDGLCNELLTLIEIQEARLLNWGFVNVRSDLMNELNELIQSLPPASRELWDLVQTAGITPEDLLGNLRERKLLFESGNLYRTRFAETVRLLYLLRQLLPWNNWQTASRLVSDLKIDLRRRQYPRRSMEFTDKPLSANIE